MSCLLVSSRQTTGRWGSYGRLYTSNTSSTFQTNSALAFGGVHHAFFSQGLSSFF